MQLETAPLEKFRRLCTCMREGRMRRLAKAGSAVYDAAAGARGPANFLGAGGSFPRFRVGINAMTNLRLIPAPVAVLLLGMSILLVGNGLLGTALGLRAAYERYTDSVIGIMMALYFFGFIVGTFLCPHLIKRVGYIRAFAVLAAIGAAAAVAHALFVHAAVWFALRVVSGICLVGLYIILESWLNEQASNSQRGRILALYTAVVLVALGLGQFLILLDPAVDFVAFGLVSILFCLGLVPVAATPMPEPRPVAAPRLGLGRLYRISALGLAGALVAGLVSGAFWAVGAVFAQRIGLSHAGIAAFMGATIFGGAVLQWPIGLLSDHRDRRWVLALVVFVCAFFALAGLAMSWYSQFALVTCMFLFGGTSFSIYALSVAHMNDRLEDPSHVVEVSSGLLLVYGWGAMIGPAVAGGLMQAFGPRSLLLYFGLATMLLGLYALLRIHRTAPVPLQAQGAFVPLLRTSQVALEMQPQARVPGKSD